MSNIIHFQVVKYLVGGVSTTLLSLSCVWFLVEVGGLHYLVALNIAAALVYVYSYLLNKILVFEDGSGGHRVKFTKFVLLQLSLVLSTNILMFLFVSMLGLNYMLILAVLSVMNACINFSIMKLKIFNSNGQPG